MECIILSVKDTYMDAQEDTEAARKSQTSGTE